MLYFNLPQRSTESNVKPCHDLQNFPNPKNFPQLIFLSLKHAFYPIANTFNVTLWIWTFKYRRQFPKSFMRNTFAKKSCRLHLRHVQYLHFHMHVFTSRILIGKRQNLHRMLRFIFIAGIVRSGLFRHFSSVRNRNQYLSLSTQSNCDWIWLKCVHEWIQLLMKIGSFVTWNAFLVKLSTGKLSINLDRYGRKSIESKII